MRPFPADLMRMWPISTRVNKPERRSINYRADRTGDGRCGIFGNDIPCRQGSSGHGGIGGRVDDQRRWRRRRTSWRRGSSITTIGVEASGAWRWCPPFRRREPL